MKDFGKLLWDVLPEASTTGSVIRSRRKSLNYTLDEVGEVTGISANNLSAIENDKKQIGVHTAVKIGLALGISPESILFPFGSEGKYMTEENKAIKKASLALFKRKSA